MQIETERLLIRPWTKNDRPIFSEINADAEVRRYFYPTVLTRAQSDKVVDACQAHLEEHGFAFLAVERKEDGSFIGGAGLSWSHDVPGPPVIEIGWILGRPFWRQGYARETGLAWVAHAWSIALDQIIGFTSQINTPSRAQMEALGMTRSPADDFADPTVPRDNPLSPHVLYRLKNPFGQTKP
jgi:RimJ/RimL family protein N-acetyltransferase